MAWQFRETAFRQNVQSRLSDIPSDDRQFIAALLGIDQNQLEDLTSGAVLTVNRLCALANMEEFSPVLFFEDVP